MHGPSTLHPLTHDLLGRALAPLVAAGHAEHGPDAVTVRHPALPDLVGRVAVFGAGSLVASIDIPLAAGPDAGAVRDLERLANGLNASTRWPTYTVRPLAGGHVLTGVACYPSPHSGVTMGQLQLLVATAFDGAYGTFLRSVPDAGPVGQEATLVGRVLASGLAGHLSGTRRASPQLVRAALDSLGWRYGTFGTTHGDHVVALFLPGGPGEPGLQLRASCFGPGPDGICLDAGTDNVFDPILGPELIRFCLAWNQDAGWPKAAVVRVPGGDAWPDGLVTVRADVDLPLGGESRVEEVSCVAAELLGRTRELWARLAALDLGADLALDDATLDRLLREP